MSKEIDLDVEVDEDEIFNDSEQLPQNEDGEPQPQAAPPLPEFTKKDKTLNELLSLIDDYSPIIPDAVTEYYLTKNGLDCDDIRIKRVLALATQKFISDIATDAYEYSRIRSSSTVYNAANPQVRNKALVAGSQGVAPNTSQVGNSSKRVVLTADDLSSALSEYGLNVSRPDFYR